MASYFFVGSRGWVRTASVMIAASCAMVPIPAASQAASPAAFLQMLGQAETRSAAKDWRVASDLWARVVAVNPVEGRFWNNLGAARYAAKDFRGAITAYQKAVELGAGAPENTAYNIACAYALLGDKDQALAWLERALRMGFLDLALLQTDSDLASLREDARFKGLVPVEDVSTMSREEGWRHDLRFLAWQIERLGVAPYRRRPKAWFDESFETLARSAPRRNDAAMAVALLEIMREVGDGHSYAVGGGPEAGLTLPLQFYSFEEGVFITAADPKHRDLLGAQVLQFAGQPVGDVLAVIARGSAGITMALGFSSRRAIGCAAPACFKRQA